MKKAYMNPCICLTLLTDADQLTTSFSLVEEGIGDIVSFDDLL